MVTEIPPLFTFDHRPIEEQVCFNTEISNNIILTDTNDLEEDRVERFMVRFIDRDNFIISHRYSILVRQFVQSFEAYTFFETLRNFTGSESLFSGIQPGFLIGNVFSDQEPSEKVSGYFDVASVAEERIFFNYDDFFPGEDLPPYINSCQPVSPPFLVVVSQVREEVVKFFDLNPAPNILQGPYFVVPRECGDCTVIGESAAPEFWIE